MGPLILHFKGKEELRPHRLDDGDGGASGVSIEGPHAVTCYWLVKCCLPSINPSSACLNGCSQQNNSPSTSAPN